METPIIKRAPLRGCYVHVVKRSRSRDVREGDNGRNMTLEWLSMGEVIDLLKAANGKKAARAEELLKELGICDD